MRMQVQFKFATKLFILSYIVLKLSVAILLASPISFPVSIPKANLVKSLEQGTFQKLKPDLPVPPIIYNE